MTFDELDRMALTLAKRLAEECGCRNGSTHFGVARARLEIAAEKRGEAIHA